MKQVKIFTLEEANQAIPAVRLKITELWNLRDTITLKEAEIDALELVASDKSESSLLAQEMKSYQEFVNRFYDLIDQMTQAGWHLKDLEIGLVDFYGIYEERLVCLCWKADEEAITNWHEIDSGFASRQPITHKKNPNV